MGAPDWVKPSPRLTGPYLLLYPTVHYSLLQWTGHLLRGGGGRRAGPGRRLLTGRGALGRLNWPGPAVRG